MLRDAAAESTFRFAISASDGVSASLSATGGVTLRDGDGHTAMALTPPVMQDAAGESHPVDTDLRRVGSDWELVLSASRRWLEAPERRWPVAIDPSVYPQTTTDCLVSNETGMSDTNFCSWNFLEAGWGYTDSHDHHALLNFDVQGAVPAGSDVLTAELVVRLREEVGTATKRIYARRVTSAWNANVTWNKRDGANAWTTPGGDAAAAEDDLSLNGAGPGWKRWQVPDMVDGWATGRYANNGVMLADDGSHSSLGTMVFDSSETGVDVIPYLDIDYDRRIGERRGFTFERFRLSDRISLQVNPGSGNLLVRNVDFTIPGGSGPDLTFSRSFNSLTDQWGAFSRWTWDTADDFIMQWYPKEVQVWGPTGYKVAFREQTDGSYKSPPGFDVTLVDNHDGTFTMTDHKSQQKWFFNSAGRLSSWQDRNGRAITFSYPAGSLNIDKLTDSQGRLTTTTRTGARIDKLTDPAGRQYQYGYTSVSGWELLTSYTDPAGGITRYAYDSAHQLTQITTPGGRVTKIDYYPAGDARAGKVKSITRVTDAVAGTGPTTQFDYTANRDGSSSAVVTDPNAHNTSYDFDTSGRPTKVTDALGRPVKRTYTTNSNVQTYTAPNNTGLTPNTRLTYDGENNTDVHTMTGSNSADDLHSQIEYGPTRIGGEINGGAYLPSKVFSVQDTASGDSTRYTQIFYDNTEGNPTRIENGTNGAVEMSYALGSDAKPGRLATTTDGRGNVTAYGYDAKDNLTSINPPAITGGTDLGTTTLDYSGAAGADQALSRITKVTDGRGNQAGYLYDGLDRVSRLTYSSPTSFEEAHYEYTYDLDGNLTERKDVVGAATTTYGFTYDALNRVTQEALPGARTNAYTYDAASNLETVTDAGGTVSYGYDNINRQNSIQEPGAASAISYGYIDTTGDSDPLTPDHGQKNTIGLPNGITTTNILDPAGRLLQTESKNATGGVLQRFAYQYKLASGKQQELVSRETDKDGATVDYGYDRLDRLSSATNSAARRPPCT